MAGVASNASNFASVESIDAHGRNVALLREDETKTTVIWLYQNQEGENENCRRNCEIRSCFLASIIYRCRPAGGVRADKNPQSVQVTIRIDFGRAIKTMSSIQAQRAWSTQLKPLKYRSYRSLKDDTQNIPWQGSKAFEIPADAP